MTQAITIKEAADRLQNALGTLESRLSPMVTKLAEVERELASTRNADQDRARLANELDELKAKYEELLRREQDFSRLANETTKELDSVISQVMAVLSQGGGFSGDLGG